MPICTKHNAHLRIFPADNNVFLWVGTVRGEAKVWRCNIDSNWLNNKGLEIKKDRTAHVTGMPTDVSSIQDIADAVIESMATITIKDQETYIHFSKDTAHIS